MFKLITRNFIRWINQTTMNRDMWCIDNKIVLACIYKVIMELLYGNNYTWILIYRLYSWFFFLIVHFIHCIQMIGKLWVCSKSESVEKIWFIPQYYTTVGPRMIDWFGNWDLYKEVSSYMTLKFYQLTNTITKKKDNFAT